MASTRSTMRGSGDNFHQEVRICAEVKAEQCARASGYLPDMTASRVLPSSTLGRVLTLIALSIFLPFFVSFTSKLSAAAAGESLSVSRTSTRQNMEPRALSKIGFTFSVHTASYDP